MNVFITMNAPWRFVYVIAIDANGNQEPHILSCDRRDQTGLYYLVQSPA